MTESLLRPDLVVVGGGPAGVMAATTAARCGLRVALLDGKPRDRIGDKVCGDALITKFLVRSLPPEVAAATLPRGDEVEDVIEAAELVYPSGKATRIQIPRQPLVTVDRLRYGQRLLRDAEAAGVTILGQHAVLRAIVEDRRVVGVTAHDRKRDRMVEVRAQLVVDASGAHGILRRTLPSGLAPFLSRDMARPGEVMVTFREICRTPEPHNLKGTIVLRFQPELPPPGYIWYFSRGERILNVGIGYRDVTVPPRTRARELYRRVLEADGRLGTVEVLDRRGGTIPARRPLDTNVAPGLLIAGDAAFHADALSGEGHGTALLAGFWAGETVLAAHRRGDFSEAGLWAYNLKCQRHFGRSFAARLVAARTLEGFSSADFDFIQAIADERRASAIYQSSEFSEIGALSIATALDVLRRGWENRDVPSPGFIRRFALLNWRLHRLRRHYDRYPSEPAGLPEWVKRTEELSAF